MDKEVVIDFQRTLLLTGWQDKAFRLMLRYIETESEEDKRNAQLEILRVVNNYMEENHGNDPRYREWKAKR
jgi:hypothetical protein